MTESQSPTEDSPCALAELLKSDLSRLQREEPVSEWALSAPRGRNSRLALDIAELIYPTTPAGSLACIIRYEKDIILLRRQIRLQRATEPAKAQAAQAKVKVKEAIKAQGPWDEKSDPVSTSGAPAIPMPVKISDAESLEPFFRFLAGDGEEVIMNESKPGHEPYYEVDMLEFQKGVVYTDHRMDLCKMVVGPTHISALMDALEKNSFVKHFLLGNNIIGPAGARRIGQFLERHPDKMETWYLAGNCINSSSFVTLVDGFVKSNVLHSVWLKRNPLGSVSADPLHRLITQTSMLRTLDLDQTELGDIGIAALFDKLLVDIDKPIALRTLYLNGNGATVTGAKSIAAYIASPLCALENLYLSYNPLGDDGCLALAEGFKNNTSLLRLTLVSCGLKNAGLISLLESARNHPRLMLLDIGHGFATKDLGQRHNYFDDAVESTVISLIESTQTLRLLRLGYCDFSSLAIERVHGAVAESSTLFWFDARPISGANRYPKQSTDTLERNVRAHYGDKMRYGEFLAGELRFVRNTPDVRYIDSVYRNRDTGLARRGLKVLDKWWDANDDTLEMVELL